MRQSDTDRWQRRLLPLMRGALIVMALFFFAASLFQYQQLYRDIQQQAPQTLQVLDRLEQRLQPEQRDTLAYVRWRTMVTLEQDAMQLRYRNVNAVLLLRTWTRNMGFLVGMVLALVGAFFILGKLKVDPTEVSGEGAGFKVAVASSSPGIVLALLGTALMAITLVVKFDFEVGDKPVYILPYGINGQTLIDKVPVLPYEGPVTGAGPDIPKPPAGSQP